MIVNALRVAFATIGVIAVAVFVTGAALALVGYNTADAMADRFVQITWLGLSIVINLTKLWLALGMLLAGGAVGWAVGRADRSSAFDEMR